ncbi:hypothetical protein Tcan_04987 [Toxocara canis]|uniref:Secreted protein n=1 Tax=Toxocara canis TaxID=6265 RepID=A0A0B2VVL0_TOXCA|nr:hypothetical protein Tcan_04987 [Toxocara canis]
MLSYSLIVILLKFFFYILEAKCLVHFSGERYSLCTALLIRWAVVFRRARFQMVLLEGEMAIIWRSDSALETNFCDLGVFLSFFSGLLADLFYDGGKLCGRECFFSNAYRNI